MDNFPDLMVEEVYVHDNDDDMDQFSLTSSTTNTSSSSTNNTTTTTTKPYFFLMDQKQKPKNSQLQLLHPPRGIVSSSLLSSSNIIMEEPSFYQVCQVYWNEIRQFLISPAHKVYRWIRYISQHKYDFCFQLLSKCFLVWIIHTVWSSSSSTASSSIRRELNPDTYVRKVTDMEKVVPTLATTGNMVTTTVTTPERGLLRAQPTHLLRSLSQEDISQSQTMNLILKEYQSRSQV